MCCWINYIPSIFRLAWLLVLDHLVEYSIEIDNAEGLRDNVSHSHLDQPADGQIGCEVLWDPDSSTSDITTHSAWTYIKTIIRSCTPKYCQLPLPVGIILPFLRYNIFCISFDGDKS
jgi:hypothetical protein